MGQVEATKLKLLPARIIPIPAQIRRDYKKTNKSQNPCYGESLGVPAHIRDRYAKINGGLPVYVDLIGPNATICCIMLTKGVL